MAGECRRGLGMYARRAGAVVILLLISPVLAAIALAIRFSMGRPILFRQIRIGQDEVPFELRKFRTMRPPRASEDPLLTDTDRVTPVGRLLRATSLDELPELWNVARGEMAFIGPRPLLPVHLQVLTPEQRQRHQVLPGMTGLAQVSGRQDLTFGDRLNLDLEFVRRRSLRMYASIMYRTLGAVFGRRRGTTTGQDFGLIDDIGLRDAIERSKE